MIIVSWPVKGPIAWNYMSREVRMIPEPLVMLITNYTTIYNEAIWLVLERVRLEYVSHLTSHYTHTTSKHDFSKF